MCENCNFDTVFLQHNRTPKVQFILFEQPVARPFRKVLNDFLHICSFLKVMAWKRMKLPGELFSSSNISSNLRCHTKPFATTGSPQGRLCTETKKMMWHLSPSRYWTSKMKKKVWSVKSRIGATAWGLQKFLLDFLFTVSLPF